MTISALRPARRNPSAVPNTATLLFLSAHREPFKSGGRPLSDRRLSAMPGSGSKPSPVPVPGSNPEHCCSKQSPVSIQCSGLLPGTGTGTGDSFEPLQGIVEWRLLTFQLMAFLLASQFVSLHLFTIPYLPLPQVAFVGSFRNSSKG